MRERSDRDEIGRARYQALWSAIAERTQEAADRADSFRRYNHEYSVGDILEGFSDYVVAIMRALHAFREEE